MRIELCSDKGYNIGAQANSQNVFCKCTGRGRRFHISVLRLNGLMALHLLQEKICDRITPKIRSDGM